MIILKSLLTEAKVLKISLQQAKDKDMFGPVFHGTSAEAHDKIAMDGFKIPIGNERSGEVSNGFETSDYAGGIPAPIHMLGFGVYFTTVKSIAKTFAGGTLRGMKIYFLDAPRREEINFASPNKMMKWWTANGYDYNVTPETQFGGSRTEWGGTKNTLPAIREERLRATLHMTEELKSKYDAVWFKGRGLYRLLDGDQVVVFDPSHIYEIDLSMAKGLEVGAKVRAKHRIARIYSDGLEHGAVEVGTKGLVLKRENIEQKRIEYPTHWAKRAEKYVLNVKFKPGGDWQVEDVDVEPLS